nr:probable LRR receptor-like serine/threonine-protein kinase At1g74360 [Ipomoea batatas]
MSQQKTVENLCLAPVFSFFFLIVTALTGGLVSGDSLETDKDVLMNLKSFIQNQSAINRGSRYTKWNSTDFSPCNWPGVFCSGGRVTGLNLSGDYLTGNMFHNFSALTNLTYLDLSSNTIGGVIPEDLGKCHSLKFLNLSHNIIDGELHLSGLESLEVLDVSLNRFRGDARLAFPGRCDSLVVANISGNNFTGEMGNALEKCANLRYVDLSLNSLSGDLLLLRFDKVKELSVAQNNMSGRLAWWVFNQSCSLESLDLSENKFFGGLPKEMSNCRDLRMINLSGNNFSGPIPKEIGSLESLEGLYLGSNKFLRQIPNTLTSLPKLVFLDLSNNSFGGEIQEIFGGFTQVRFLLLHGNGYTGGIVTSGITKLVNLSRLDLSYNNFSAPLPVEISRMTNLKFLVLAFSQFTGPIPSEYGNFPGLQALDLSSNALTGPIPPSLGRLTSLLWLMLANNSLTGEIPPELGNCSSLLWLNLASNELSGPIPPELANIGANPMPTFLLNRAKDKITPGSGECLAMKRWIFADYPPFSFVYPLLTRKNCRNLWDLLLKGAGIFPVCELGSTIRTYQITGYVQLSGNKLSGLVPSEIGKMRNFSMLHLGNNNFHGNLPAPIGGMPLIVLNLTHNKFSGKIPPQIGNIKCLQNLDLSYNSFNGAFPTTLNNLTDLNKFNISYNPDISGEIPETGQIATFDKWSFLGDPLLRLPAFINTSINDKPKRFSPKKPTKTGTVFVFAALVSASLVCGIIIFIICLSVKPPRDSPGYLLEASTSSLPWISDDDVKVIRLGKTSFTHSDILKATKGFSDDRIIGRGGCGTVYRGVLPDGREVAVKKLQREGVEGEREFRAEMEVLSGNGGLGWPHPNLVMLYGWCLDGAEKLLVYQYMEGGSLDNVITDRVSLPWKNRLNIAIDIARALVFLHHECYPGIIHRDVKASNVLLDKVGRARVTDFGLARVMDVAKTHISTVVAGTIGYVAPEYGQTWKATTKGDVYSYGVLAMELATARRAVDGGEECLLEWARRVMGDGRQGFSRASPPVALLVSGLAEGAEQMCELLRIGIWCTAETPHFRPNMKEVLDVLLRISPTSTRNSSRGSSSGP